MPEPPYSPPASALDAGDAEGASLRRSVFKGVAVAALVAAASSFPAAWLLTYPQNPFVADPAELRAIAAASSYSTLLTRGWYVVVFASGGFAAARARSTEWVRPAAVVAVLGGLIPLAATLLQYGRVSASAVTTFSLVFPAALAGGALGRRRAA